MGKLSQIWKFVRANQLRQSVLKSVSPAIPGRENFQKSIAWPASHLLFSPTLQGLQNVFLYRFDTHPSSIVSAMRFSFNAEAAHRFIKNCLRD